MDEKVKTDTSWVQHVRPLKGSESGVSGIGSGRSLTGEGGKGVDS